MAATETQCVREDRRGVRCCYGDKHSIACRFGPTDLEERHYTRLRALRQRTIDTFGVDAMDRALANRGFARLQPIGMRWWRVAITPAGARALQDEPA